MYDKKAADKRYNDKMKLIAARVSVADHKKIKTYCFKNNLTISELILLKILDIFDKGDTFD